MPTELAEGAKAPAFKLPRDGGGTTVRITLPLPAPPDATTGTFTAAATARVSSR